MLCSLANNRGTPDCNAGILPIRPEPICPAKGALGTWHRPARMGPAWLVRGTYRILDERARSSRSIRRPAIVARLSAAHRTSDRDAGAIGGLEPGKFCQSPIAGVVGVQPACLDLACHLARRVHGSRVWHGTGAVGHSADRGLECYCHTRGAKGAWRLCSQLARGSVRVGQDRSPRSSFDPDLDCAAAMTGGSMASQSRRGGPMVAFFAILAIWTVFRCWAFSRPLDTAVDGISGPRIVSASPPASSIARHPDGRRSVWVRLPSTGTRTAPRALPLARTVKLASSRQSTRSSALGAPFASALRRPVAGPRLALQPDIGSTDQVPLQSRYPRKEAPTKRWSGDAWLVLRQGESRLAVTGSALPIYGGSQAGAVVRFDFAPDSQVHPSVFLRAAQALGAGRKGDLAVGLSMRPAPGLPVTAHAELRIDRRSGTVEARPAAFVTTGVDDAPIAFDLTARGYAEAGYVGGRDATPFADGSLIAEHPLSRASEHKLAAGAGAWGGAQRGARRLDLGPTGSMKFRLGNGMARVSVDYRLRVAGNAAPARSGALTLSAGF